MQNNEYFAPVLGVAEVSGDGPEFIYRPRSLGLPETHACRRTMEPDLFPEHLLRCGDRDEMTAAV